MAGPILLASDLDRTLLPNGSQPESPAARPLLRILADRPEVTLAYVSGRHEALIRDAIAQYELPWPDYAIGDVGTTIYQTGPSHWVPWAAWARTIGSDWNGLEHQALAALFEDLDGLTLQEPERQNTYKLSYYTPAAVDRDALLAQMQRRLGQRQIKANLVWSVDETRNQGLLDVLPASASKRHAIQFLMKERGFKAERTVFAGDSGNDLEVLTSAVQAVVVANATEEVKAAARKGAAENHTASALYVAQGGFLGMNGNYSAGVLEGLAHYVPEVADWLKEAATS